MITRLTYFLGNAGTLENVCEEILLIRVFDFILNLVEKFVQKLLSVSLLARICWFTKLFERVNEGSRIVRCALRQLKEAKEDL